MFSHFLTLRTRPSLPKSVLSEKMFPVEWKNITRSRISWDWEKNLTSSVIAGPTYLYEMVYDCVIMLTLDQQGECSQNRKRSGIQMYIWEETIFPDSPHFVEMSWPPCSDKKKNFFTTSHYQSFSKPPRSMLPSFLPPCSLLPKTPQTGSLLVCRVFNGIWN